jgi:AcrR family transcriptional regulator
MSNENGNPLKRRKYEKRRRAEAEADTRRRITEAAVQLHGSIGPARTTISGIAAHAGVQRATVYRHFPDEPSLFDACSSHWAKEHPLPDPAAWRSIADPEERVRAALTALYAYYRNAEPMLANVTRDAESIPALRAVGERRRGYIAAAEDILAGGFGEGDGTLLRAQVGLAIDFGTWRLLVRSRGLDDADAVELMTRGVRCAAAGPGTG